MIGLVFWTLTGAIGLFAIGHIFPPTKKWCRKTSKSLWKNVHTEGKKAVHAHKQARRQNPKVQARIKKRTARKDQPLRLTAGRRPKDGDLLKDKAKDRWNNRRNRHADVNPEMNGHAPKCGAPTQDDTPCQRKAGPNGCGVHKVKKARTSTR